MSSTVARPADQAGPLRRLTAQADIKTIAVVGAKGGVGASSVTLALTEAFHDPEVAAVDAHVGQADLAAVARLWRPGSDPPLLAMRDLIIDAPETPDESVADQFAEECAERRESRLVIDSGAASAPWATAIARRADTVLLVATPDRLAALNAYAAAKRMRAAGVEPSLVWNGCADAEAASTAHRRLAATCARAATPEFAMTGWLPAASSAAGPADLMAFRRAAARLAEAVAPGRGARRLERGARAAA